MVQSFYPRTLSDYDDSFAERFISFKGQGGVYDDDAIRQFISDGVITSSAKIKDSEDDSQIQPSSLDLTVGDTFYNMPHSSLFLPGSSLEEQIKSRAKDSIALIKGGDMLLTKGQVYLVQLRESLHLGSGDLARANPKSSTGRIDLHARLLTQDGESFDTVSQGYSGPLWLELYSQSFDIRIREGDSLNQLRIFTQGTPLANDSMLKKTHNAAGIIFDSSGQPIINDLIEPTGVGDDALDYLKNRTHPNANINRYINGDSLVTRASVPHEGVVGYVARHHAPVLDLSRRDLPASEYFDPVFAKDGSFIVNPNSFYILNSSEQIGVPSMYCAEMVDSDLGLGEFRVHYAGFFDPGFKAQGVLELRSSGQPFEIRNGQPVARLRYYPMSQIPQRLYGDGSTNNYQGQKGAKLAKFFDMNK